MVPRKHTPAWDSNPWKRNDPGRCPCHLRQRVGVHRLKGRCTLPKGHKGSCSLLWQ